MWVDWFFKEMYTVVFSVPGVGCAGSVECEKREEAEYIATRKYVMEEYIAQVEDSCGYTVKIVWKCSK